MTMHEFSARGISLTLDLSVGHIADLVIERAGRQLRPLHRAPWIDEPAETLPADLPDGVLRLSGDFLCAPFSRSDVEPAPLHGWPANSAWDLVSSQATSNGWRAQFRLKRSVMGAAVDKILILRDDHPFLYQEHVFSGGSGEISVAHHAMTAMGAGGALAFSPKRFAWTPETPTEPDPSRGRYRLAYPGHSQDIRQFPAQDGGVFDLTTYQAGTRHEDFVILAEAEHDGPGWTAVTRHAESDLVLILKNPVDLPVTMLWISNGGRDYAPWNGRHAGVLGIEDGRTAIGHAASIGDNPLKDEGIATTFALGANKSLAFRQIIGVLPLDDASAAPTSVATHNGVLSARFADGITEHAPFDDKFLAG